MVRRGSQKHDLYTKKMIRTILCAREYGRGEGEALSGIFVKKREI